MAKLAVDLAGQLQEPVANPATPTSGHGDREMRKQLYRERTATDEGPDLLKLAVDSRGRVAGECPQTPKGDSAEQKERFRERVQRKKGTRLQPGSDVLAVDTGGVIQAATAEEAVCAAADGTIHKAHITSSPKRSPKAEKKKQALRARWAREVKPFPETPHPVFTCDPAGTLGVHDASAEVVIAGADGTIHHHHVRPLSAVHGTHEKKKAKAIYRTSPKHGPSPVMKAQLNGMVELGLEPWNFWRPEVAPYGEAF